ncbi:MAG: MFS transporter [Planctomycetota bacterium]
MSTSGGGGNSSGGGGGGGGSFFNMSMLSGMMFLQYAVWGVWLPYLAAYLQASTEEGGLGFTGGQVGWILGLAGSFGAVTAPFIAGQIADRFLNAEKALGLLLVIGGVLNFSLYYADSFPVFLVLSICYSIAYMPTLALTNSIAFAHLKDPEKQFPPVRLWGTIGWIVASNAFPLIWLQTNLGFTALPPFLSGDEKPDSIRLIADCLRVSGVLAVSYGIWAMLMLPKTPPKRDLEHPFAFARAFSLLKHKGFLVCTLVALPISMIHQVYFIRTSPFLGDLGFGAQYFGPIMSLGQFSEIFFLAILGLLLTRLGYRLTLTLGCLAYAVRFGLFGMAEPDSAWIVVVANVLHGLCYGCFFAGAYIYVERVAPKDVRHSAQTVFGIIILGAGPIFAGFYNQWLDNYSNEPAEVALVVDDQATAGGGEDDNVDRIAGAAEGVTDALTDAIDETADAIAGAAEEIAGDLSDPAGTDVDVDVDADADADAAAVAQAAEWEAFNWRGLWFTQAAIGLGSAFVLLFFFRPGLKKPEESGLADEVETKVDVTPETHPPTGRPTGEPGHREDRID